ncbi:MAG: zinc-dependent alcohol dehydrogenase family protein [Candidatus Sericytochromatia bacterium]
MKAAVYHGFGQAIAIEKVPQPVASEQGVVIRVLAAGVCRSDWHGWLGHDQDVTLPHVPGHEFAGVVSAVGSRVSHWRPGDRVTLPFVCGCGSCEQCLAGQHQVCDRQFQAGFTHWGAFAEYVAVDYADTNLVRLPDSLDPVTAASLGCRFVTAFRALVDQGRLVAGQWLAVHGCGGVGLSAVMIGNALGANVIAIDIHQDRLELARELGACATLRADENIVAAVQELSGGGAHVSLDALGSPGTCFNSIANLRKQGCHVQVGLMGATPHPAVPMDLVIAHELRIIGSHGIQAHRYPALLAMIEAGKLRPEKLIGRRIALAEAPAALMAFDQAGSPGITVIDRF